MGLRPVFALPEYTGAPECDGLLLPGGGDLSPWRYQQPNLACRGEDPLRDQLELDLLADYASSGKPILGICRGLQVINVFFGGTLIQDVSGHTQLNGQDRLHRVTTAPGSFLYGVCGSTALVNSAHHQAADRLGAELVPVQHSSDGLVEGLCHARLPIWALQWHPERLRGRFHCPGAVDGQAIFAAFSALFPPAGSG